MRVEYTEDGCVIISDISPPPLCDIDTTQSIYDTMVSHMPKGDINKKCTKR